MINIVLRCFLLSNIMFAFGKCTLDENYLLKHRYRRYFTSLEEGGLQVIAKVSTTNSKDRDYSNQTLPEGIQPANVDYCPIFKIETQPDIQLHCYWDVTLRNDFEIPFKMEILDPVVISVVITSEIGKGETPLEEISIFLDYRREVMKYRILMPGLIRGATLYNKLHYELLTQLPGVACYDKNKEQVTTRIFYSFEKNDCNTDFVKKRPPPGYDVMLKLPTNDEAESAYSFSKHSLLFVTSAVAPVKYEGEYSRRSYNAIFGKGNYTCPEVDTIIQCFHRIFTNIINIENNFLYMPKLEPLKECCVDV